MMKIIGPFLFLVAGLAMATEEPKYELLEKKENFELRAYETKIIAEVEISGSLYNASGKGFRLIADYIFGNNTSTSGAAEKISMTAPVAMEQITEEISMTKPVSMQKDGAFWRMNFVMPSEYTMESLPAPNNSLVSLREVPASSFAVIRFSGLAGEEKIAAKTDKLLIWMEERGLSPIGQPILARYNPPWTLPFMRRNEVMVEY